MVISFIRSTRKLFFAQNYTLKISKQLLFVCDRRFSSQTKNLKMEKIIAVGQMRSTNDKAANRQQVQQIVESATQKNACFVFLPECCDYVGKDRDESLAMGETLTGETVQFYQKLAKEKNVYLSLGGIHEVIVDQNNEKTDKMYNSHIVIDNMGKLVAVYRKLHLYDVETPEFKFQESKVISGGTDLVSPLTDTPLEGGLGLLICYDLRFPEVSTLLRKNGATYLTYPSAFAYPTGFAHWESLLRARAIENQCFVIAATQVGYHNEKRRSFGRGMIVDPWGKILAECDKDDASVPQCITANISLDVQNDVRSRMPCFNHRRDEVYSLVPLRMIPAEKSVCAKNSEFEPLPVVDEKIPYFVFEKYSVPKSTTFLETPASIAFTNINCVVTGHILVATRRCVSRLKDLTPDEIVDFFTTVCKCQRMLEEYYKTTSSTVTVQDGEHAGQTVRHVHCHIMPRKEGDFKHNDEIYIELNKHDHPKDGQRQKFRSVHEQTAEANEYRKVLAKSNFFQKNVNCVKD